jgi:hypothetical protein
MDHFLNELRNFLISTPIDPHFILKTELLDGTPSDAHPFQTYMIA